MFKRTHGFWLLFFVLPFSSALGPDAPHREGLVDGQDRPQLARRGDTARVEVRGDERLIEQGEVEAVMVSLERVRVQRGARIEFSHPFPGTVILHLEDAPVTPKRLVLNRGVKGRALVRADAEPGSYKYSIEVRLRGQTVLRDPYIDVEPGGD